MKRGRRRLSWRTKLTVLLLVFSLGPMGVVTALGLQSLSQTFEQSKLASLEAIAGAKAEAIDQFTGIRRRDVEQIASLLGGRLTDLNAATEAAKKTAPPVPEEELPELEDAENLPTTPPKDAAPVVPQPVPLEEETGPHSRAVAEAKSALAQVLGLLLWDQSDFEELLVIGIDGKVIAATFNGHEGRTAADLDYFKQGRKRTFLQPVFRSPITEELTMVISTPIRNLDGNEIGVLAARLNLKRFFLLINDYTGLGTSGETIAAKAIDDQIVFMTPTRHDDLAALQRSLPLNDEQARALKEGARGASGSGEGIDYRGVRVLAAWHSVPSLEWGLVTKIDYDEAMAGVYDAAKQTLALVLGLALLVIMVSVMVSKALVRPLRDLRNATERISRGDFDVDLDIAPGDELGELADSFERMVAAIKFFREHARSADEDDVEDEEDFLPEPSRGGDDPSE